MLRVPILLIILTVVDTILLKDGSLKYLVPYFNSEESSILFKNWKNSQSDYSKFFKMVSSLNMIEPSHELNMSFRSKNESQITGEINCKDPKYSAVFNGDRLYEPRIIVDFMLVFTFIFYYNELNDIFISIALLATI